MSVYNGLDHGSVFIMALYPEDLCLSGTRSIEETCLSETRSSRRAYQVLDQRDVFIMD